MHVGHLDCSGTERARERGVVIGHCEDHPDRAARIQSARQVRIKLHQEPRPVHEQLADLEAAAALGEFTEVTLAGWS
jgi:hypothetical protein